MAAPPSLVDFRGRAIGWNSERFTGNVEIFQLGCIPSREQRHQPAAVAGRVLSRGSLASHAGRIDFAATCRSHRATSGNVKQSLGISGSRWCVRPRLSAAA